MQNDRRKIEFLFCKMTIKLIKMSEKNGGRIFKRKFGTQTPVITVNND